MKALKSELANKIIRSGIKIPSTGKFLFEGKWYIVRRVPKAD